MSCLDIHNGETDVRLGPLWAQASTAPSRLYKCFPSEGGILVPAIVKPARGTLPHMEPGSFSRAFTTCMDLAPTALELAGISLPPAPSDAPVRSEGAAEVEFAKPEHTSATAEAVARVPGKGRVYHRGRAVYAMTGKSWVRWFGRGESASDTEEWAVYPPTEPVGWELQAMAALRMGDWKIVHLRASHGGKAHPWRTPAPEGQDDPQGWELFNVASDPGETRDLSSEQPEKLAELLAHWEAYCAEFGLVWGEHAMDDGLSLDEASKWHDYDPEMQRGWIVTKEGGAPSFDK